VLDLFCSASHSMEPGAHVSWGGLRFVALLFSEQLLGPQHFQGPAAGVDLVVMGEIGEPFEDVEQVLVPGAAQDLHITGAALGAERPELVSLSPLSIAGRYGEATERAHQMECLALPGLSRIPARNRQGPAYRPVWPYRAAIPRRRPGSPPRATKGTLP
jgi:hypothetical protein